MDGVFIHIRPDYIGPTQYATKSGSKNGSQTKLAEGQIWAAVMTVLVDSQACLSRLTCLSRLNKSVCPR